MSSWKPWRPSASCFKRPQMPTGNWNMPHRPGDAAASLERALPESGFASAEEARRELLPPADVVGLEKDLADFDAESSRLDELFAGEDLVLAAKEASIGELPLPEAELAELSFWLPPPRIMPGRGFVGGPCWKVGGSCCPFRKGDLTLPKGKGAPEPGTDAG